MKIALYHNLPSGGAKRTVFETVRRLSLKHRIDLYCPSTADRDFCPIEPYVTRASTFEYHRGRLFQPPFGRLNSLVRIADIWRLDRINRRISEQIEQEGYDVVLVHPCMIMQSPSILRFLRIKSAYYCQEIQRSLYESTIPRPYYRDTARSSTIDRVDFAKYLQRSTVRSIDRASIRSASRVLTNSTYTQQLISTVYGVHASVNRLGVDVEQFIGNSAPKQRFVLSVGALRPEKGFDFVIKSLGRLKSSERPPLVIASNAANPEERQYIEHISSKFGVQTTFESNIGDKKLVDLYNAAAVTAYSPIREPFGLVSLESQSCETPIVGVAEGGVRETIIHGQTGLLVEREPDVFSSAIAALLSDPRQRATLGTAGRLHVCRDWTWEASVQHLEAELTRAAASA